MSSILNDPLIKDLLQNDIPTTSGRELPTEVQHPTDLITATPYWELTLLLTQLGVLPEDVHLMSSTYWDEYNT